MKVQSFRAVKFLNLKLNLLVIFGTKTRRAVVLLSQCTNKLINYFIMKIEEIFNIVKYKESHSEKYGR